MAERAFLPFIANLLIFRQFENGKFSFLILLDRMSLPSVYALAKTVQLYLVFSKIQMFGSWL